MINLTQLGSAVGAVNSGVNTFGAEAFGGVPGGSNFGQSIKNTAKNDPGAFGQLAQGITKFGSSLIGGGARRREQRRARAELAKQREAYETFEFKDPSANLTNPFEDLTVNQQQAQFAAQQQQQALAGTLGQLQDRKSVV